MMTDVFTIKVELEKAFDARVAELKRSWPNLVPYAEHMRDEVLLIIETKDRLVRFIKKEIRGIESDVRYNYAPANVEINAPLALIQVDMKARVSQMKKILNFMGYELKEVL